MEDGLRVIIEAIALLIGAGGITAFITAKANRRKLDADAESLQSNSFLELVDRMEIRLDKQDKEIIKLQQQVESLISKVTQLEEGHRIKDAHIAVLTGRIKYLIRLLREMLAQLKEHDIKPNIVLPSWVIDYDDCEEKQE